MLWNRKCLTKRVPNRENRRKYRKFRKCAFRFKDNILTSLFLFLFYFGFMFVHAFSGISDTHTNLSDLDVVFSIFKILRNKKSKMLHSNVVSVNNKKKNRILCQSLQE